MSSRIAGNSFRDPAGCLLEVNGRLLRAITAQGTPDLQMFLASSVAQTLIASDRIVRTKVLGEAELQNLPVEFDLQAVDGIGLPMLVEHERVPFQSFPHEWPPELLYAAATLTLDLSERLLSEHIGLKDATPYNILFRGPEPVFVDVLSSQQRDPGDPLWLPYAQFVRSFIIPLLLYKHFGMSPGPVFLSRRDGLELEDVYALSGPIRRFVFPFLTLISIPKWLGDTSYASDPKRYRKKQVTGPECAMFILRSLFKRLRRLLDRVAPVSGRRSSWTGYMGGMTHYTKEQFATKQLFVDRVIREFRPRSILDVGCNTGFFSFLAAKSGARVVAIDSDPVVAGDVWRVARKDHLDVLPLVVDLTRPTPAVGWRNRECLGFLERARGAFDAVLMLAVIHHMLVSERIPLVEIIDLTADLTRDLALLEYISPQDPMFKRLTRGRDELFTSLTTDLFESIARRRFEIVRSEKIEHTERHLYLLRKIPGVSHA
jgi:SAM-dependent methyltransferase